MADVPLTRQEQKQRTRRALIQAALRLLEHRSLDGLGLREVTREAGISPTAFYRHFRDIEELGLALVDESFGSLRDMIRAARTTDPRGDVVGRSVEILGRHVHGHRAHFRFIARERYSSMTVIRKAIRREIRLFTVELAADLGRLPDMRDWPVADVQMMADVVVQNMVATVESLLDAPIDRPEAEAEILSTARRQLLLINVGVPNWRPRQPETASTRRTVPTRGG